MILLNVSRKPDLPTIYFEARLTEWPMIRRSKMTINYVQLKAKWLEAKRKADEDFNEDRNFGEEAEQLLIGLFQENETTINCKKQDHELYSYDLFLQSQVSGRIRNRRIEVKRLAGCDKDGRAYPTGFVEVWLNDARTARPKWHSKDVTHVFFYNNHKQLWHVYEAQPLIKRLQEWEGSTTKAGNDSACNPGSGIRFYWEPQENSRFVSLPGFVGTFTSEQIKEIEL